MESMRKKVFSGFTVLELLLVVAIAGVLASITIPRVSQTVGVAKCSTTKGNLGALRSALAIYYSENEGRYPVDTLSSLTYGSRFLPAVPRVRLPEMLGYSTGHPDSTTVTPLVTITDVGGWLYVNNPNGVTIVGIGDFPWGGVVVNCTHNAPGGQIWCFL